MTSLSIFFFSWEVRKAECLLFSFMSFSGGFLDGLLPEWFSGCPAVGDGRFGYQLVSLEGLLAGFGGGTDSFRLSDGLLSVVGRIPFGARAEWRLRVAVFFRRQMRHLETGGMYAIFIIIRGCGFILTSGCSESF